MGLIHKVIKAIKYLVISLALINLIVKSMKLNAGHKQDLNRLLHREII